MALNRGNTNSIGDDKSASMTTPPVVTGVNGSPPSNGAVVASTHLSMPLKSVLITLSETHDQVSGKFDPVTKKYYSNSGEDITNLVVASVYLDDEQPSLIPTIPNQPSTTSTAPMTASTSTSVSGVVPLSIGVPSSAAYSSLVIHHSNGDDPTVAVVNPNEVHPHTQPPRTTTTVTRTDHDRFASNLYRTLNTWKLKGVKFVCIWSVALEPFYGYFTVDDLYDSKDRMTSRLSFNTPIGRVNMNSSLGQTIYMTSVTSLATTNLACDLLVVTPAEDAYHIIKTSTADESWAVTALKYLSLPSYFTLASADAIAVAGWFKNNDGKYDNTAIAAASTIGLSATMMIPGCMYYHMLQGGSYAPSVKALTTSLNYADQETRWGYRLRAFEATLQAGSMLAFRGISTFRIAIGATTEIFELGNYNPLTKSFDPNAWNDGIAWGTTASTVVSCAFSRAIRSYNSFCGNKKMHKLLTQTEIDAAAENISNSSKVFDMAISVLVRGGPIGILMYKALPNEWLYNALTGTVSSAFTGLMYKALQSRRAANAALKTLSGDSSLLATRKTETGFVDDPVKPKTKNETLLENMMEHFEAERKRNPNQRDFVSIMESCNITSGIMRGWLFYGFIADDLPKAGYNTGDDLKVLCLALLWGVPTMIAERTFYQPGISETAALYSAKFEIGAPTAVDARRNAFTKTVLTILTPIDGFDEKRVQDAHDRCTGILPPHSSTAQNANGGRRYDGATDNADHLAAAMIEPTEDDEAHTPSCFSRIWARMFGGGYTAVPTSERADLSNHHAHNHGPDV